MPKIVDINKSRYEELRKNPVFFLKFFKNIHHDKNGNEIDDSTWHSLDRDLNINFDDDNFADRGLGYCLCIIDKAEDKKDDNGNVIPDVVKMTFHNTSPNNVMDWIYIINSFVIRSQNKEDKYAFLELLWALDKLKWNSKTLISAFSRYPSQTIPFLITNFQKFGRILSYYKQEELKRVCSAHNGQYSIYSPGILKQAYDYLAYGISPITFQSKPDYKSLNLFSIIDAIFEQHRFSNLEESVATTNTILMLHSWLHGDKPLGNYNILLKSFSTLSEKFRLQSIKRYFHDIRNSYTSLDISFLQEIKENKYDEFNRYRYCIESPAEPVVLTVPLLCDTLITLYSSKGHSFQTFDGVLDFAMTHCDTAHPAIDFKVERFIPSCNRGAVYNAQSFKGFIDYALIRKLNESLMSEVHLRSTFIYLMDKHAIRQKYPACKYGDGTKLTYDEFKHCSHDRHSKIANNGLSQDLTWHLECFHYLPYEDRWTINNDKLINIKGFLKNDNIQYSQEYDISLDMLSIEKLRAYIRELPKKYVVLDNDEFLVSSYKRNDVIRNFDLYLVQEYSDILRMRVFPQEGALVGLQFDVFGFWKEIRSKLPEETLLNTQSEQYKEAYARFVSMESQEVRKRCIDSLKKELNCEITNDSYFELPYDRTLLSNTIKRFYHKDSFHENDKICQHEFLTKSYINSPFVQYCAPKLSEAKNPAIDLPYFWCRGKECFLNNLGTQKLEDESNWNNYSLYHMAEIMGYPMLHKTEAGYEPEPAVWQFIAVTNKVMQKFKRLKCRSCGHMMFTDKSSGFNRYNYYACANPTCIEVSKVVYLNFCYKCKKGLIDSRDTKQCPNGWYICPTCLACCDNEQYERQAQRYILTQRPVPTRIEEKRGHGHNDKDEYFCPQCGNPIHIIKDEHGNNISRECPKCNTIFDAQPDGFYN